MLKIIGPSGLPQTTRSSTTRVVGLRRHLTDTSAQGSGRSSSEEQYDFGDYDVILPKEPFVWGVSHITPRTVPPHIRRPRYALAPNARSSPQHIDTASGNQHDSARTELDEERRAGHEPDGQRRPFEDQRIDPGEDETRLRNAARLATKVLKYAGSLVKVGVTTEAIDSKVHQMILSHSAYPSPLLYKGFPKSCCTSVNNIVTHGIPDSRQLQDGDIINIDITVFKDGFHGDTSQTFLVGDVDEKGLELVQVTRDALEAGIAACGPGRPFKGIGRAIHELIRHKNFCVSTQFTGHGIGGDFHRRPWILHHLNDEPGVMLPGHCFTIEPCIIQGSKPSAWMFPDGWTVSTENCARSAQAEHMVLIKESGVEVLTRW
ncbi:hypothetical protein AcW1_005011 [Taiwanofungus camphoratus]|nr:hypothetical protein AcW2_005979 [Antrodia cinnamomea]KAI0940232.1 hypothetical protein AcV5_001396 [Antrodia cinnamomea]KAI0960516.1 hypothetical protein AcW1_005011 [Antrodia cinnamomea]